MAGSPLYAEWSWRLLPNAREVGNLEVLSTYGMKR